MKTLIKRLLGRSFSPQLGERLTEYALDQRPSPVHLGGAQRIAIPGSTWEEVANGGRKELWRRTLGRLDKSDILLLEFGVFQGDSLRTFVAINKSPRSLFYGFDSFEGLPEAWRTTQAGHFSTGGKLPDIADPRIRFVKGWFQDSLPSLLDDIAAAAQGRAVVVHFDADLYSSTLYLLFTLTARIPAFTFIFDEYADHEARALYNFIQATGAKAEFSFRADWQGFPAAVSGTLDARRAAP